MALPGGMAATDFTNFPLADFGRTVTRTPRTRTTDNITGRETWSDGTPASITAIAMKVNKKWMFDEVANIEGGDAFIQVASGVTLSEGDLITIDSVKYYIKNLISVTAADTVMCKYGNLFIWSD